MKLYKVRIKTYYWFSDYGETMKLDAHYTQFKELTWNDEPIEVEFKLVK